MLTACSPNIYIPNATNIPLPNNKDELKVGGGMSSAGVYFEGSYALDSHIVVMAEYAGISTTDTDATYFKYNFGEIGGGYYSHIGGHGRFEFLGGFGIGNLNTNLYYHPDLFTLFGSPRIEHFIIRNNFERLSIQADIAISSKYAD